MDLRQLTVVFSVSNPRFARLAAAAAWSLYRYSVPVTVRIDHLPPRRRKSTFNMRRMNALQRVDTAWALLLDADCYFQSGLEKLTFDKPLATRQCPRQVSHPRWNEEAYQKLFELARLPYVKMAQGCAFLIRTDIARVLVPEVMRWREWAHEKMKICGKPWRRPRDQYGFALARSEMGLLDNEVNWWDSSIVSLAPDEPPLGMIHHLGYKRYVQALGEKQGLVPSSIVPPVYQERELEAESTFQRALKRAGRLHAE